MVTHMESTAGSGDEGVIADSDSQDRRPTALITGAAGNIGTAVAGLLGSLGWALVMTDIDDGGGETAAATLRGGGTDAVYRRLDVTVDEDWRRIEHEVALVHGGLDLLYFNSGSSDLTPLGKSGADSWRRMLDLHVTGALSGIQAFAELLRNRQGSVVLTSSIHAHVGFGHHSAYAAAKGGLEALTRQLAVDLAPMVRVNCVALGSIFTAPWSDVSEAELASIRDRIPLARIGRPEDVAPVVAFLASRQAGYVTGQAIVIDGGRTIWSGE